MRQSLILVVNPSVPVKTVPEFIAYAKAPGKINMASPGAGTTPHVAGEPFEVMAGVNMLRVPYRGAAPGSGRRSHGIGTHAYLALMLLLDTGQRRGDVIRMGRQHVRDGFLSITQEKTGMAVDIPVTSALAAAIAAFPNKHLTFLVTRQGKPFSADRFTNWFRGALYQGWTAEGFISAWSAQSARSSARRKGHE